MTDTMMDSFTRPIQLELVPPGRRDSAQAVMYRVAAPTDLLDLTTGLTPALREALTERVLPKQRVRRKRWIATALMDGAADLHRPPHGRRALVLTAGLSKVMPGGLLIEHLADLGPDQVGADVVITWLAEHAGAPGHLQDELSPEVAQDPAGTFTVGDLDGRRPRSRRYGVTARTDQTVQAHVRRLNMDAMTRRRSADDLARFRDLYAAFDETAGSAWRDLPQETLLFKHATSSALHSDLSVGAAAEHAQRIRQVGAHPEQVWQRLQLAGFLNPSGNRRWNREIVEQVGGWR